MNIANKLTFTRIFLAFICIGLILVNQGGALLTAFVVFIIASITDFLDGYLARKYNLISDLGKLLDPIADKILIIGVFLGFLQLGAVNVWPVAAIMLREFILTGFRFFSLNKGVVLEAKQLGKHKTVSQIMAIVVIFITLILEKYFGDVHLTRIFRQLCIPILIWYVAGITLFSGFHYFWTNRRQIKTF